MRSPHIQDGVWLSWLRKLPLPSKLMMLLVTVQGLALTVGGVAILLIRTNLVHQLGQQSLSELSVLNLIYQQQQQQTALGFRGLADNPAVIAAAVTKQRDPGVWMSFWHELWTRDLELVSLVDPQGITIISPYDGRDGSPIDLGIEALLKKALVTGQQVVASELTSYAQLASESRRVAQLRAAEVGIGPQDSFLVQYTVTPVRAENSVIMGLLISGDVIRTNLVNQVEVDEGFSAIYWGDHWLTNLEDPAPSNVLIQGLVEAALGIQDNLVKPIFFQNRAYSVAAKPILNLDNQSIAVLLHATSHADINHLVVWAGIVPITAVGMAIFGITLSLGRFFSQWVVRPLRLLGIAAQSFAEGNLFARAPVMTEDELGVVAEVFNEMADQVQARTELLQAELNVARKLQQMILPRSQELEAVNPFDIAVFMEAATEVGGDYYDVLTYQDALIIGIGDVTGHGLESGVLMIMVQMAIRTLLVSEELNLNTLRILQILNQSVYDNLQRMGSDRNLTLSLLKYENGELTIAGQHEQVLWLRAGHKLERIDTWPLGMFIGLEPDIDSFLGEHKLKMGSQDIVVLYTDGVTEAENPEGVCFGLDRLTERVQALAHCSAQDICDGIINQLKTHIGTQTVFDDITLMVLKHR